MPRRISSCLRRFLDSGLKKDIPFSRGQKSVQRIGVIRLRGQPGIAIQGLHLLIYQAVQPPSTTRLCPVMYADASEARNIVAPVTSSRSALRPRGTLIE